MPLESLMIVVTSLGSPQSILILCAILAIFLALHRKNHHLFQFIIFMSLGALSVWLMKRWLEVPRPTGGIIEEYGFGFPSGHATMATLFSLLLVYAYLPHIKNIVGKWALVIFGLIVSGSISYSRIYLGVHSINDVVGGICLGAFWFMLSVMFYTYLQKRNV